MAYFIDSFLSPRDGLVNQIIVAFGGESVFFWEKLAGSDLLSCLV